MIDYERLPQEIIPEDMRKEYPRIIAYQKGPVRILLNTHEKVKAYPGQQTKISIHLSISCADRNPTWDEIKEARYRFMDRDRDAYMILPAERDYVNLMSFCFHLYMPTLEEVAK